ncbi:hypothetical protein ACFVX9_00005, partial [Kitasatospora sp. NPDC058243]
MIDDEHQAARLVSATRSACALFWITVEEQGVAIAAPAPVGLLSWGFCRVGWEAVCEAEGFVSVAGRACAFLRKNVEEQGLAFLAVAPVDQIGHGILRKVLGGPGGPDVADGFLPTVASLEWPSGSPG